MHFRPFDFSEADFQRYVQLRNSIIPDQPASVEHEQRFVRDWPADQLFARLLVLDKADQASAAADYSHTPWSFHAHKFQVMIFVRENARRQGIGAHLFDLVCDALAPHEPQSLESITREDWQDGVRFLEQRGFKLMNRQQQSRLDPREFDPAQFSGALESVSAAGLEIKSLGEAMAEIPNILRQLYDLEIETMPDVPWYDEMTAAPFEIWAQAYTDNPDLLPDGYTVALDGDKVAGLSQLWGSQATDTLLYTGYTAVRQPYRRCGLATALKVHAIDYARRLSAADGRPPRIVTANEESNPMLQINLRLGFKELPAWLVYVRREGDAQIA